jgi:diguanylate cyclase (GGDEF)-like protein
MIQNLTLNLPYISIFAMAISFAAAGIAAYLKGLNKGRGEERIDSEKKLNALQKNSSSKDQMILALQTQVKLLREKEDQLTTLEAQMNQLRSTEDFYSKKVKPLEERLHQRGREISLLSEASLFLTSGDFQQTCDLVAFRAGILPHVKFARLLMLNEGGNTLRLAAGYNISENYLEMIRNRFELSVKNNPAGMAVENKVPFIVNDVMKDEYFSRWREVTSLYDYRSYVAMPLLRTHRILGVLEIFFEKTNVITKDILDIINIITNLGALALENCLFTERLEELSVTDGMTKAFNHAFLLKIFEQEIERAARYSHSLSFVMFDLDKFKQINDTLGHLKGDEVLMSVVGTMKQSVRGTDYVCRYGGDEFAILLPETGREDMMAVIEKIRQALSPLWKSLLPGTGVSIGYAVYPENGSTSTKLINHADNLIYEEKKRKKQVR